MPAMAVPVAPDDFAGFYVARWGGLPSAELRVALSVDQGRYGARASIDTIGISRWLTGFRSMVASDGTVAPAGDVTPTHYRAEYDLRGRAGRVLSFRFDALPGGTVATREPGDSSTKPQLDEAFRRDVLDPLAAMMAIRQHLLAAPPRPGDHFTVPVYDGARRYDVETTIVTAAIPADHLIHLALSLRPIAGFKGKTTDEPSPGEQTRAARATFTDDARHIPTGYEISIAWLDFVVRLDHLCADFDHCAPAP